MKVRFGRAGVHFLISQKRKQDLGGLRKWLSTLMPEWMGFGQT